jgi:hypothetical protein
MTESTSRAAKALAALVALALASRWAPVLCSLLTIVVMINYGGYAWRAFAKLPPEDATELMAVVAVALGIGFLAKLGIGPLIVTGAVLLTSLPLWRRAKSEPPSDEPTVQVDHG